MVMRATLCEAGASLAALVQLGANVNRYANVYTQMHRDPLVRLRRKGIQNSSREEKDGGDVDNISATTSAAAATGAGGSKQRNGTTTTTDQQALADDPNVKEEDLFLDGPLGATALGLSTRSSSRSAQRITRMLLEAKADVTQPQCVDSLLPCVCVCVRVRARARTRTCVVATMARCLSSGWCTTMSVSCSRSSPLSC